MTEELMHYGTPRHSGRYPWGSGEDPNQRNSDFLSKLDALKRQGKTPTAIAKELGITTTQLRAQNAIAIAERRAALAGQAQKLRDTGMGATAIGKEMGMSESSVRSLLDASAQDRNNILKTTADTLRESVEKSAHGVIDIGGSVDRYMGISPTKLTTAAAMLVEEGYKVHKFSVPQLGTNNKTTWRVLAKPDVDYNWITKNPDLIEGVKAFSEDKGRSYMNVEPPRPVSSKRIAVRWGPEGGDQRDGLIELRPGPPDISLGHSRYAQVRINVDGTHYLKGMAVHNPDLPPGVDIRFNTNKPVSSDKFEAFKPLKKDKTTGDIDEDLPFGSVISQRYYVNPKTGKRELSALNRVGSPNKDGAGEEGAWDDWSRALSSQFLSKQRPELAKTQLDLTFTQKKAAFDEINSLNNPAVKKRLMDAFAESCDSTAVTLKAHALPRQRNQVLIPIPEMKDNEIYAPQFRNGETVVLVRHPHGGTFEIPQLTVNNRNPKAKAILGDAEDAVGINHKVAARLSGADFDGDTVLVIPNSLGHVTVKPALKKLEGFDPIREYPGYEGMKYLEGKAKQKKMGEVSNLITDMTLKGATDDELARAVKHSMVVIDAEKHKLDYRRSYVENSIAALRKKYQIKNDGTFGGASTLISRAKSDKRVPERKLRAAKDGGPVDPKTGKLVWVETGNGYTKRTVKRNGETVETWVPKTTKGPKMALVDDANELLSINGGTRMEQIYATHANKLKALANQARLESLGTPNLKYSPTAAKTYAKEVASLNNKLAIAMRNAPLERLAQAKANAIVNAKRRADPTMENDELRKVKNVALMQARAMIGAGKVSVQVTPEEWHAIQAGAITHHKLTDILKNTDLDLIKKYATPREAYEVTPQKLARARAMLVNGHTQGEIAELLGVPASTLNDALKQ